MTTGPELTDTQRTALEAQIAYAEALARAAAQKKGCLGKISAFLAHPAAVTAIGSGLLSLLVLYYQHVATEDEHKAEHARQIRDKRLSIASASIADFDKSGMILINLQILKRAMETGNFPHKLSREEASAIYKSMIEKYMAQPHRFTTVVQLDSWYSCDSDVVAQVSKLDRTFKVFEALDTKDITPERLKGFQDDSEKELDDLSSEMVASVQPNGKCY